MYVCKMYVTFLLFGKMLIFVRSRFFYYLNIPAYLLLMGNLVKHEVNFIKKKLLISTNIYYNRYNFIVMTSLKKYCL